MWYLTRVPLSLIFLFKLALAHPTPASSTQNIQKRRRIDPLAASDDEGKEGVQLILAAGDFEDDSEDAEEPTDADKQAEAFAAWTQDGAAKFAEVIAAASKNVDSKTDRLSLADLRAELHKVSHSALVYAGLANVRTDLKQVQRLPKKKALVQIVDKRHSDEGCGILRRASKCQD